MNKEVTKLRGYDVTRLRCHDVTRFTRYTKIRFSFVKLLTFFFFPSYSRFWKFCHQIDCRLQWLYTEDFIAGYHGPTSRSGQSPFLFITLILPASIFESHVMGLQHRDSTNLPIHAFLMGFFLLVAQIFLGIFEALRRIHAHFSFSTVELFLIKFPDTRGLVTCLCTWQRSTAVDLRQNARQKHTGQNEKIFPPHSVNQWGSVFQSLGYNGAI
ncbi:hypothetical protein K440DRAFT_230503 [Wilcoxina mikolae CBS 423.85]|nr:hypothetical protein K440DRAFT_230503 [Wilcoxina mikolae CBS 423.85]